MSGFLQEQARKIVRSSLLFMIMPFDGPDGMPMVAWLVESTNSCIVRLNPHGERSAAVGGFPPTAGDQPTVAAYMGRLATVGGD